MKVLLAAAASLSLLLCGEQTSAQNGNPCTEERQKMQAESERAGGRADPQPVIACYTRALESGVLAPIQVELTYSNRAWLHAMRGDYETALSDLDQAIARTVGLVSMSFRLQHRCYFKSMLNRFSEALVDCDRAISLNPKDPRAFLYRAMVHLKSGDSAKALIDYERILTDDAVKKPAGAPFYYEALYGRDIARQRLGDVTSGQADVAATEKWHSIMRSKFSHYGISEY